MPSILDTILAHKRETELPKRIKAVSPTEMRRLAETLINPTLDFAAHLRHRAGNLGLIAEVKRASPSRGDLVRGDFDPVGLATIYEQNGASAISVLTDERFFRGSLTYLTSIKKAVSIPVLRKDFVIDSYQLYEARAAGADAVLLIVAALENGLLRELHETARGLSLAALVEVHDEIETERALDIGARIIGVNNRDLRAFVTDISTTAHCASLMPAGTLLVSESGIFTAADAQKVASMGAQAILVGESIITSSDIAAQVRLLSSVHIPSSQTKGGL